MKFVPVIKSLIITRVVSHLARSDTPDITWVVSRLACSDTPNIVVMPWVQSPIRPSCISEPHFYCMHIHIFNKVAVALKVWMPKLRKKSPIHENTDANITCDFGDGDIRHLGVGFHTHTASHTHKQTHTHIVSSIVLRYYTIYNILHTHTCMYARTHACTHARTHMEMRFKDIDTVL